MNNTKPSKKQLKKQKAKEKTQESLLNKEQGLSKDPSVTIKYCGVPQVITVEYPLESESKIINVKNRKINILEQEINESINVGKRIIQIVGQDLQIPKAISLGQIVKRRVDGEGKKYIQNNVLGRNENKKVCMKISLNFV